MDLVTEILILFCLVVIIKDILLVLLFRLNFKMGNLEADDVQEPPFVSVLIAARNEEDNIIRCVNSIRDQDYPEDKFEILVGNDRSEDDTLALLKNLEGKIPNLKVYDIEELIQKKHGKMNVLAQLGNNSSGQNLLFTDADTWLPQSWISTHVNQLKSGYSIVTGTTLLKTGSTFENVQNLEWGHAIGMMKVVSDLGNDVSSIGNNMSISREAYEAVGGFKGIPFSITEDYEIFHQITKRGFRSFHIFSQSVLAESLPVSRFWDLLIQRKRWMFGAFRLPLPMLITLIVNSIYYPLLACVFFLNVEIGVTFLIARIIIQGMFIKGVFKKLNRKARWSETIVYEFYAAIINFWAIFVFLLPIPVTWKKRRY